MRAGIISILLAVFLSSTFVSGQRATSTLQQLAVLTASDGAANDQMGYSLAVSGDTVVAGDPVSNAVYVFTKPASGWENMTQVAKLTPSDGGAEFGDSVSISGPTIVVSAPDATIGSHHDQGAVYVFVEPAGGWADGTETAKLTALDGKTESFFGRAVSLSDNALAVTAPGVNDGLAYVFVRPAGGWSTTSKFNARLVPTSAASFGNSVSVDGGTVVVGAAEGGNIGQGAAYVFLKPGTGWRGSVAPAAELTASNGVAFDELGFSVAVSGDTVVAGAIQYISSQAGAAYVFVEPSGGWSSENETAELTASGGQVGDLLGCAVALAPNILVAGAYDAMHYEGAAYVFKKPTTGWTTTSAFYDELADGGTFNEFGIRVAPSPGIVVVSAPEWSAGSGPGAVFVYGQ